MRTDKRELQVYCEIFDKINSLLKTNNLLLIAIDGKCGSGKSTLADILKDKYDCNLFRMDDFFLRPELKTDTRLSEVGGNVDYERFRNEVIEGILSKKKFSYQVFDCSKMELADIISVNSQKINIIEGAYSMHPTLIEFYNLKIFVDIDYDEQKIRILNRNPMMYERFINEWIPKENQYFDLFKIKEKSDIIIRN